MAQWLLACKEISGRIYVSRLPRTTGNPPLPGVPSLWFYVGPGLRPSVHEYNGNQFILLFEYLSHLTARVLDISTWPPTQVEPISNTSPIIIGAGTPPQAPDDQLFLRLKSTTGAGVGQFWLPGPQITSTPIIIDPTTNTYSVVITTQVGWTSGVPGTNYYRVYRQPLLGGAWTMVQNWVAAPLNYTDSNVGSLRFKYRATLGYDYDPNHPNDPSQHFEGDFGNVLSHDSTTEPLEYVLSPNEPVSFSLNALQSQALASFGTRQQNLVEAVFDEVDWKIVAQGASQGFADWDARKAFVVFSTTLPTLTPPTDVVNFKVTGNQGQATLATSARLDQ